MEILKILAACLAYAAIMWVVLSAFILALIAGEPAVLMFLDFAFGWISVV